MLKEKFFYQYHDLKISKDEKGVDQNYTIKNLAENQLFFRSPTEFNDPFDSRAYCFFHGTREQFKNSIKSFENVEDNQLDSEIDLDLDNGIGEIRGGLIFVDYRKLFSKDGIPLHGDIPKEMYPKICCFSGTCRSILMCSHYADRHRGICLRFRSLKNRYIKDKDIPII